MAPCSLTLSLSVILIAMSADVGREHSAPAEAASPTTFAAGPSAHSLTASNQSVPKRDSSAADHSPVATQAEMLARVPASGRLVSSDSFVPDEHGLAEATAIARREMTEIDRLFYELTEDQKSRQVLRADLGRTILLMGRFQLLDTGNDLVNRMLVRDYTLARYGDLIAILREDLPAGVSLSRFDRTMLAIQMDALVRDKIAEVFGPFNERQSEKLYRLLEGFQSGPAALDSEEMEWLVISLMGCEQDPKLFQGLVAQLSWQESRTAREGESVSHSAIAQ